MLTGSEESLSDGRGLKTYYKAGVHNLQDLMLDKLKCGGDVIIIIEIKCTIKVMHLNHSETTPPSPRQTTVCRKIVFHKTGPCCQKVRDCCYKTHHRDLKGSASKEHRDLAKPDGETPRHRLRKTQGS